MLLQIILAMYVTYKCFSSKFPHQFVCLSFRFSTSDNKKFSNKLALSFNHFVCAAMLYEQVLIWPLPPLMCACRCSVCFLLPFLGRRSPAALTPWIDKCKYLSLSPLTLCSCASSGLNLLRNYFFREDKR